VMEVRALYGRFSCGWLGGVCAWRHTLRGGSGRGCLGAVVARPAMGATGGARRLGAF